MISTAAQSWTLSLLWAHVSGEFGLNQTQPPRWSSSFSATTRKMALDEAPSPEVNFQELLRKHSETIRKSETNEEL
jgi:hypothetical protein